MRARLGVATGRDELRAVLARQGRVVWHARAPVSADHGWGRTMTDLLSSAPLGRIRRPRVVVVLGLAHSDVKPIHGLPATGDAAVINRVVRENAESFFLRMGLRLTVTDVERRPDGTNWVAAFDGAIVDELVTALRGRGLTRVAAIPHVAVVARLSADGTHRLVDDGIAVELTTSGGGCVSSIRRCIEPGADDETPVPALLASIGEGARAFASAYAAATMSERASFAWLPSAPATRTRSIARARVIAAAALLVATSIGAVIAPGVRAAQLATRATRELASARSAQIDAARLDGELRRVTAQLEQVDLFRATRGRVPLLLGQLSQSLPESTALVSLRIDTLEASFVAMTPRAADVVPQLIDIDGVTSPRIIGSVTRETQGAARLERATFRFGRPRAPSFGRMSGHR